MTMKNNIKESGKLGQGRLILVFILIIALVVSAMLLSSPTEAVEAFNLGQYNSLAVNNNMLVSYINKTLPYIEEVNKTAYKTDKSNPFLIALGGLFRINYLDVSSFISLAVPGIIQFGHTGVPNHSPTVSPNSGVGAITKIDYSNAIPPNINEQDNSQPIADQGGEDVPTAVNPSPNNLGKILIYHTHTTESYYGSGPDPRDPWFTTDSTKNMIAIGKEMKKQLEALGYEVIHEITYHDLDGRTPAYTKSTETLRRLAIEHPDISFVFDVHRDGRPSATPQEVQRSRADYSTVINGERVARVAMVLSETAPNASYNRRFAQIIESNMNKKYPGLFYRLIPYSYGYYSQHIFNNSVLFEIGCNANLFEEAMGTMKYLVDVIDASIKEITQASQ